MRPNADAWPNLLKTQGTEPFGCEWRSDGIVALSWPAATIHHCKYAKQRYVDSQLTCLVLWLVDQAALANQFAFIITASG
jgi:hypothetical protein